MDITVQAGESVQAAIDAAHEKGGGRVVLEPGVHHSRSLFLKSFVELHVATGAKLQGGSKSEDYDDFEAEGYPGYGPEKSKKCFIAAAHAENIAITGTGEINGAGPDFYDTNVPPDAFFAKPPHPRPRMVQLYKCTNVRIEGPSFIDSPSWTFWLIECRDVFIHRIRIQGCQQMINQDGIDIDGCKRVTVSDSFFRTGDDCIILRAIPKTPDQHPVCEEVVVTNCVLDSWCQGIRVGCPSDDTIRNCTFSNLVIKGRGNGINVDNPRRYLKSYCNGRLDLSNILFNNIVIESGRIPIRIFVEEGITLRRLRGLTFSHVRIKADKPCLIQGSSETCIEDVRFLDVRCDHEFEISKAKNITMQQVGNDNA
jgi:polygalacturonase